MSQTSSGLAFNRSDASIFGGTISGSGSVSQIGTGNTILTANSTYTGGTTISAGTLQLGNGGAAGSIVGNVANSGVLAFNRSDASIFVGTISGTGSVSQVGTGTTILTATAAIPAAPRSVPGRCSSAMAAPLEASSAMSQTAVCSPSIVRMLRFLSARSAAPAASARSARHHHPHGDSSYTGGTTISAGSLQLGNGGAAGSIVGNVANSGVLAFNRSDASIFVGTISGSGSVSQIGTGTTILTADSSYTGGTTISAGTLQLGNGGTAGSIVGNVANSGVLAFNRSDASIFVGTISGSGSLSQVGTGTTILTADSSYTGGTTISAGTLQLGNGGTAGSIVGNVANSGVLAFNRSDASIFVGTISGSGSLSQIGTGTTILTADSSYTGGTTISAGTLQLGNGGASGSIAGNVINNGVFAVNRSDSLVLTNVIAGPGSFQQNGTGTTVLSGNNLYSGPTAVNTGTLIVDGSIASSSQTT